MAKHLFLSLLAMCLALAAGARTLSDSGYRTVGHIKPDGTVQDASYRTLGHAPGIPIAWAALFFFFMQ